MPAHNNGRAFRLTAKRWKRGCKHNIYQSGGCRLKYKHCNPQVCLGYKEKYTKKEIV